MRVHLVAERSCHTLQRLLERRIGERLHPPAIVTDEVVVVIAVGMRRLIASDAVADVDPLHEAQVGELVDGTVDARDPDAAAGRPDAVEDLLRRQAAALPPEVLDDGEPGPSLAQAGPSQPVERLVRP